MQIERYIIVGASGLIGSELCSQLTEKRQITIGTAFSQPRLPYLPFDITKQSLLDVIPDLCDSDVVMLMSAATDLKWIYSNALESRLTNVESTINVINCAQSRGAKIIYPSSENIFDGEQAGYSEQDVPRPLTLYGKQKVEIESYLKGLKQSSMIVRFGWNIGWRNKTKGIIEALYSAMLNPGARFAFDNYFTITNVTDTVDALIRLIDLEYDEICHIAANPPISRDKLADMIIAASRHGSRMSYEKVPFSILKFEEPRPKTAWLKNDRLNSIMDFDFMPAQDVVLKKVAILDDQSDG
jgi:dTDP-4-dehydrorhamnose reductase